MEASPISVNSNDSGYSSDLPSSSYDGSHLHWKSYRQHVLQPHRIHILDSAPKECIPDTFLALIEAGAKDPTRFNFQKTSFQEQRAAGRAFGPSPLFPPNLLPPCDKDQGLAQCMLPSFSREALPSRLSSHKGPLYELSVPRSNLGYGFSASVFTSEELECLPSFMIPTGTVINYENASISPGVAIYAPFLTFERAHGVKEQRLEAANNQCALGGAWSVHAMNLLQARAFPSGIVRQTPIAFSCAIDNTFAIVNLHWTDQKQHLNMSPLCKFDLTNDEHLTLFLVWIEAIGLWAVRCLLPEIRKSLQTLLLKEPTPPPTPEEEGTLILTLNTGRSPAEHIMRSLKTTFDDVPWRYDSEDCTPVSSSTASWGSPVTSDVQFIYQPRSQKGIDIEFQDDESDHTSSTRTIMISRSPSDSVQPVPSPDLVLIKRINHCMEEIHDLHAQIYSLKTTFYNATNSTQSELGAVKVTLASILRKETLMSRNRSLSMGNGTGLGLNLVSSTEIWHNGQAHIISSAPGPFAGQSYRPSTSTIPSTPRPDMTRSQSQRSHVSPRPSSLTFSTSNKSLPSAFKPPNTPNLSSLPTPEPSPSLPPTPLTSRSMIPPTPYTPYTPYTLVPPPPPEYTSRSLIKWSAITFSAHMAASFIPIMSLRIIALGIITEAALLGFSSPHYGVSWEWMMELVHRHQLM